MPDESFSFGGNYIHVFAGAVGDADSVCTTSPNSTGQGAVLGFEGSISVGNANMRLTVSGAVAGEPGLFYYGSNAVQVPFGNGVRCIASQAGAHRLFPIAVADAGGQATLQIDFNSGPVVAGQGAWLPGGSWFLQYWYRDPAAGGSGFNLSDALSVVLTP